MKNPMTGRVTSHYDLSRRHPVFHTIQPHRGIDLGAPEGTEPWRYIGADIHAAYAGTVEAVESNWRSGWGAIWGRSGNGVFIRNPDGEGQYYGHLDSVSVRLGQSVTEGQVIGGMGSTGNVTGPHLHFEVHNRGSGPSNNYTWTRDPRADFNAANIIPGISPIIPAATEPTLTELEEFLMSEAAEKYLERIAVATERLATALTEPHVDFTSTTGAQGKTTFIGAVEQQGTLLRQIANNTSKEN